MELEISRLKKQIKLLAISTITLVIVTVGLLLSAVAGLRSAEAWPDTTLGKVTVRELRIVSADGSPKIAFRTADKGPSLAFFDDKGDVQVILGTSDQGGFLSLHGPAKNDQLLLSSGYLNIGDLNAANVTLAGPSVGGPRLILQDANGYTLTLGRTDLLHTTNGDQTVTSAASIVATSKTSTVHWPLLNSQQPIAGAKKKSNP
jgi:hypothetical protein